MRNRVLIGDSLELSKELESNSIHTIVTSPPYYGLRDYGTRRWFDETVSSCTHDLKIEHQPHHPGQVEETKWRNSEAAGKGQTAVTHSCSQCGAWYGQLGLEPTPEGYVAHLVTLFRELRRALRSDGTFWLNIGDGFFGAADANRKPKDMVGMPWKLAFALQDDGWWLRSDIIWTKWNVKPESVQDRPTRCYEHIFLLTKSESYFYDQVALRERTTDGTTFRKGRDVWEIPLQGYDGAHFAVFPPELPTRCIKAGTSEKGCCAACGAPWIRMEGEESDSWTSSCKCKGDEVLPAIVLDPFAGSGTTLACAVRMKRSYLGFEINPKYSPLIEERINKSLAKLRDEELTYIQ